jgi:predicted Rossmann fold flavoprotein
MFFVQSSRDLITMLEKECGQAGVETRLACRVSDVRKENGFIVATEQGAFRSDSLVIATGGLSYAHLGASGFGHEIARAFGLKVTKLRPALVPFVLQKRDRSIFGELAGVSLDSIVSCGKKKFRGNILFTHKGLSGPAALQASLYWGPEEPLKIDLLPSLDAFEIFRSRRGGKMEMRSLLAAYFPKRFAQTWCDHVAGSKPINQYPEKELREFAGKLHAWVLFPQGTEGYEIAEVTAGGVDTDAISSKTMEAKDVPGLYFIGEVLDVTGELGGYNLHWAWASGYVAGQYV